MKAERLGFVVLAVTLAAVPAFGQVASSLINEGDTLIFAGTNGVVSGLDNVEVNHNGGWALVMTTSVGAESVDVIYGTPDPLTAADVLRSEGMFGGLTQTSFIHTMGYAADGTVVYKALATDGVETSIEAIYVGDTLLVKEPDPMPAGPFGGLFWSTVNAPQISADGDIIHVGGGSETEGGSTIQEGLFDGSGKAILYGTQQLPGLPAPLQEEPLGFGNRISKSGNRIIAEVQLETTGTGISSSENNLIVVDGMALMLGGSPVQEGTPVPAAIGGNPDENWDNFDTTDVNDAGEVLLSGDTDGDFAADEFYYVGGTMVHEGDTVDGQVVDGFLDGGAINENGDWVIVWEVVEGSGSVEAMIVNGEVVLKVGDEVDLDGDGLIDLGTAIDDFEIFQERGVAISDRDASGNFNVYVALDVDDGLGGLFEGLYQMEFAGPAGTDGDLQLTVVDTPDPQTMVPGTITYTVSVRNNGSTAATGVQVVSTLDGTVDFASGDPIAVHDGTFPGGTVTASIGNIPPYGTVSYAFTVTATTAGNKTTTSTLSANEADPVPGNNDASNDTFVGLITDLDIAVTDSPDPLREPNGQITYTVDVTNFGPSGASGVEATLTLDPNTSFVSSTAGSHDGSPTGGVVTYTIGALANGATESFDVVVEGVNQALLTVTAEVTGNEEDPDPTNNTVAEETLYELLVDLFIEGEDSPDPINSNGTIVTYTMLAGNDGPSTANGVEATLTLDANTVFVSTTAGSHDGAPAGGVVTVPVGDLGDGDTFPFEVQVEVTALAQLQAIAAVTAAGAATEAEVGDNSGPIVTHANTGEGLAVGIFTNIAGHPKNDAPDLPGVGFGSSGFDRIYMSPNTQYWAVTADSDLGSSVDELVIAGDLCSSWLIAQEGTTATAEGDLIGFLDTELGVDDIGSVVFATNTDGSSSADEVIVKYDADTSSYVTIAREGDVAGPTGQNFGFSLDGPSIESGGLVWFIGDTDGDTDFDEYVFWKNGNAFELQEGVSVPTGQTGTNEAWDNFDTGELSVDGSGNYGIQGDLEGDFDVDDVFAVNNDVKIQEGAIVPGSSFASPVDLIDYARMLPTGSWYVYGDNEDDDDWMVRNGLLIAATGDPITPGSPEIFTDVAYGPGFFGFTENNLGHYVIMSVTNGRQDRSNAVVVLNGETVVAREDDLVDLDGNGVYDDNVRINTFSNDDLILTDDLQLYMVVTLRPGDGSTSDIGDALIRLNLCGIAELAGDLDGDGDVDSDDYVTFEGSLGLSICDPGFVPCADLNGDGTVNLADYALFQVAFTG